MSAWKRKRFWEAARAVEQEDGWRIELDGRPVRTPGKHLMLLPAGALAEAVAAEWQAQEGEIDPRVMPLTRAANSALDTVTEHHAGIADQLAEYGDTDLICYRAETPPELAAKQAAAWNPMLDWAEKELGAALQPRTGIVYDAQSPEARAALSGHVHALDPFALTAFHDLVSLSGSLILGFAALHGIETPERLWALSRIDEDWQQDQWGRDDDAAESAERKRSDFLQAHRLYLLLEREQ